MSDTPRLLLPLIASAQVDSNLVHNDALAILDAIVQLRFTDRNISTPPGSPVAGSCYLIGTSATGAWSGHDGDIAFYNGGWIFFEPVAGLRGLIADEGYSTVFDGTYWHDEPMQMSYKDFYRADEGLSATTTEDGVARFTNGTGATSASIEPDSTYGLNRIGLIGIQTGTTTTGRSGYGGANPRFYLGQGEVEFETDIYIPTLSDGTNTFTIAISLADNNTTVQPSNSVGAYYTHGTNGGAWYLGSSDNGSAGTTNGSGSAVSAGTWYRVKIVVNAAASSFEVFINGTSIGTRSANIPTASGRALDCMIGIFKSAGTSDRTLVYDRRWFRLSRTTLL